MTNFKEVVYPSWDKQYFNKDWDLMKTVFRDWVVIDFSWRKNKVTRLTEHHNFIDDIPF